MDIKELCQESYETAKEHGFWDYSYSTLEFPTKAMLIVTEIAEMVEAHRAGRLPAEVMEELADVWIRLADFTEGYVSQFDYGDPEVFINEIKAKMDHNRSRPHKHGKRY